MELRKCACGADATEYQFGIQCNNCGLRTIWFANHQAAVNAWNLGLDLIQGSPSRGNINAEDKILGEIKKEPLDKRSPKSVVDF